MTAVAEPSAAVRCALPFAPLTLAELEARNDGVKRKLVGMAQVFAQGSVMHQERFLQRLRDAGAECNALHDALLARHGLDDLR